MATIATLTQKTDGSLEGTLATLNVTAQIVIVPNGRKAKDNEPGFRILSRRNGFGLGGLEPDQPKHRCRVRLGFPQRPRVRNNIASAPGDDDTKKVIIWNPAN